MGHGRSGGLFRNMSKIRSRRRSSRGESRGRRRCKFTSQEKPWHSVLSLRQPRLSTSESDTTHRRPRPGRGQRTTDPHRVRRENSKLCFGGAALKTSTAAYSRVCLSFGVLASRATWIAAVLLFFAASSPAASHKNLLADASASAAPGLSLFSSDSSNDDSAATAEPQASRQAPNSQPQFVIERIEFIGNRRIRSDTLKARIFSRESDPYNEETLLENRGAGSLHCRDRLRIFSRESDPYNEETLRRDFQALWNTQFFEDVKLRVEDSPDRPDGKIIIFEVKERPQIRRIRYEGIHSVTESDILDRFKERKVGLSVESPFDPTRIKKAEVVLKELLGEHGRQF